VRQGNDAADHLVGLAGVYAETYVDIKRRVELGESDLLHLGGCFGQGVDLAGLQLAQGKLLVLCQFCHVA